MQIKNHNEKTDYAVYYVVHLHMYLYGYYRLFSLAKKNFSDNSKCHLEDKATRIHTDQ